jgi:3-phenylpropionate/trans-cinnamate dioxygenase ferredoxin component
LTECQAKEAGAMSNSLGEDWHFAGNVQDFEDEDVEQLKVGPLAVAVYRAQGQFYATQDLCTHERAYLSDGVVIDCIVECPFHQGRFDVRSGKAMGAPVIVPLKTYPLKVVDGRIYVQVSMTQAEADAAAQAEFGT